MTNNNEIQRIKSIVGVTRSLIIDGNVNDIFLYEREYLNIHQIIEKILFEKNFSNVIHFDRGNGLKSRDLNSIKEFLPPNIVNETKKDLSNYDCNKKVDTCLFYEMLRNYAKSSHVKKNAFIQNYSKFEFTNLTTDDNNPLTNFQAFLNENKFSPIKIGEIDDMIIFITDNLNQLPANLYLGNPNISFLSLSKPTRKHREDFLNLIKPKLNILDIDNDFNNIIDSFEGYTLKEISNFVAFSSMYDKKIEFSKLWNIYFHGEQKSPWESLSYEKLAGMSDYLKSKVIGQDEVIKKVTNVMYKAFVGLSGVTYSSGRKKPKGTLFFVGPTGVGKTELAKAITQFMFNDEANLIRFDMSEYNESHSDQKLIGAPPGYVGYESGGQLTKAVKEKPFSILLFDEIEKAHPLIFDKFLQILEDGRLTDSTGQIINFSETFIIFTSNIGAAEVSPDQNYNKVAQEFIEKVRNHFIVEINRPEILGRFGNNILPFNFISDINLKAKIILQKLEPIKKALYEKYQVKFTFMEDETNVIKTMLKGFDERRGGRDIINSIESNFVEPLSQFIFNNINKFLPNKSLVIKCNENKFTFYI